MTKQRFGFFHSSIEGNLSLVLVLFGQGYHSDLAQRLYLQDPDWTEEVPVDGSAACNDETASKYFPLSLTIVRLWFASLSSDDRAWNAEFVGTTLPGA